MIHLYRELINGSMAKHIKLKQTITITCHNNSYLLIVLEDLVVECSVRSMWEEARLKVVYSRCNTTFFVLLIDWLHYVIKTHAISFLMPCITYLSHQEEQYIRRNNKNILFLLNALTHTQDAASLAILQARKGGEMLITWRESRAVLAGQWYIY